MIIVLEVALVFLLLAVVVYAPIQLLTRGEGGRSPLPAARAGQWHVGHRDIDGVTRIIVEKHSPDGLELLDEHLVASVPVDDPDYDAKFLEAMETARQRRSLFEAEEQ